MAKKDDKKDLEYDELDDLDLDIPDIDIGLEEDDRTPVRKLTTGFAQGVKDDLKDKRDASRKLKSILPPTYSSSIDVADETLGTVGNLYNTLRDETREGVKSVKRVARQAVGKHEDKLPDWMKTRLNKVLGEEENTRREPTVEEQRNEEIQATLGNIFEMQVRRDEAKDHEESGERAVQNALEGKRHETQLEQLFGIRQDVHRQVSYQDQVTARFQRKSLEIQYRQYFMTRDLFKVSEAAAKDTKEALQAIVKNTGLPEYRKIELTEAIGQQFRDNLTSGIQNKVTDLTSGFFSRAGGSLSKAFKDKASGWNDTLQSMAGMGSMLMDSGDMVDGTEMAGSTMGGAAIKVIFDKMIAPMARQAGVENDTIRELGEKIQRGTDNLPREINEWIKTNLGTGGIAGFIADSIGGASLDRSLNVTGIENSLDPAIFDQQTRQSIVEIIPGYLSRIHQELQAFRKGMGVDDPDPNGRLTFSSKERGFVTADRERDIVKDMVFNPEDLTRAFDKMTDVIDSMELDDHLPADKAEEAKSVLSRYLMKESLDGNTFNLERMSDASSYGDDVDPEMARTISLAVKEKYNTRREVNEYGDERFKHAGNDNDRVQKKLDRSSALFRDIGSDVKDPRQVIQAMLQIGGEDSLRELGVLSYTKDGKPQVDYDSVFKIIEQGGVDALSSDERVERRENRRYDRWGERKQAQEEAVKANANKKENWLNRRKEKVERYAKDRVNRVRGGEDKRDRDITRAEESNRGLPVNREAFYGGLVSDTDSLFVVSDEAKPSPLQTPLRVDRGLEQRNKLNQFTDQISGKKGREALKRRAGDAVQHMASEEGRREVLEGGKSAANKVVDTGRRTYGKVRQNERVQQGVESFNGAVSERKATIDAMKMVRAFDPEKVLGKASKDALKSQLVDELMAGREVTVADLADSSYYFNDMPSDIRKSLVNHFTHLISEELLTDADTPKSVDQHLSDVKKSVSSIVESKPVSNVRSFVSDKKEAFEQGPTLNERWSNTKSTVTENVNKVYDTNKSFSDNVDQNKTALTNFYEEHYDSNKSLTENAQEAANKLNLTTDNAKDVFNNLTEHFTKTRDENDNLVSMRNNRFNVDTDYSTLSFAPENQSVLDKARQKVSQAKAQAEEKIPQAVKDRGQKAKTSVETTLASLIDPKQSMVVNARKVARRLDVSVSDARKMIRQHGEEIASRREKPYQSTPPMLALPAPVAQPEQETEQPTPDLTLPEDEAVKELTWREKATQALEKASSAVSDTVANTHQRFSDRPEEELTDWDRSVDPSSMSSFYQDEQKEKVVRQELRRVVNENPVTQFFSQLAMTGRGQWDKLSPFTESESGDVHDTINQSVVENNVGGSTNDFSDRWGSIYQGGNQFNTTGTGDYTSTVAHPTTFTPHVSEVPPQETPTSPVTAGKDGLMGILRDVRAVLRGEEQGVGEDVRGIVERLKEPSQQDPATAQVAVLSRILENIEAIGQHLTKNDEESWFNILDVGKKTGRVMGRVASGLGNFYLGGLNMLGGGMKGIGGVLGGAGKLGGRALGGLLGRGKKGDIGAIDVYIKGQPNSPVLKASEMEAGNYHDSVTGDTITTVDQLRNLEGDVVTIDEETGKPNLVVSAVQLSKGLYDRMGDPVGGSGLLSGLASSVGRGVSNVAGAALAPAKFALKAPKAIFDLAGKVVNRVKDVYVKGESTPRLLATVMKNGGYVSAATGRPIATLKDIDGEIMDRQGRVVLSHADMQQGLVDWKGEPMNFLDRQINRVLKTVTLPFKAAGWGLRKAKDALQWGGEKISNVVGGITNGFGSGQHSERTLEQGERHLEALRDIKEAIVAQGSQSRDSLVDKSDRQIGLLQEVRDLIKGQKEGKKPHAWDRDGDGDRDGSWQDLASRSGDDDPEATVAAARQEKDGSFLDTLMKLAGPILALIGGGISTIMGKVTGLFGTLKDMIIAKMAASAATDVLGGGGDGPDGNRRRRGRGGRRGTLGRAGKWIARQARTLGGKAVTAARTAMPFVATHGGRALAWVGAKAATGAAIAGGVLTAPVLATGAAVIGAGVLAYFAWKHFSASDLGDLGRHRMMQYGVDPDKDDEVKKMLYLEDELKGNVSVSGGEYQVDTSKLDFEEIVKQFEIDPESEGSVNQFLNWLNGRFLPVYYRSKAALSDVDEGKELGDVDELKILNRKRYFEKATNVEAVNPQMPHPYTVEKPDFGDGSGVTQAAIQQDKARIMAELEKQARAFEHNRQNTHTGDDLPPNHPLMRGREETGSSPVSSRLPDRDSEVHPRIQIARENAERMRLRHSTRAGSISTSEVATIRGTLSTLSASTTIVENVSPMDAVMLKAMGLKELEATKASVLLALMGDTLVNARYTGDGEAIWEGDVDSMYDNYRKEFGISWYNWGMKDQWKSWFRNRFLKVYLSVLNEVRGVTSRPERALDFMRNDYKVQLLAAEKIAVLDVEVDGQSRSLWDVTDTPWTDYAVNVDATSINGLIAYLRRRSGSVVGDEPTVNVDGVNDNQLDPGNVTTPDTERQDREQERDRARNQEIESRRSQSTGGNSNTSELNSSRNNRGLQPGPSESSSSSSTTVSSGTSSGQTPTIGEGEMGSRSRTSIPEGDGYKTVITEMVRAGITDPEEQAMMIAQFGHESAGFSTLEENMNYGADGLMKTFRRGRLGGGREVANQLARNPEAIANRVYGGTYGRENLGNTEPGDGWKYRGRGFLQISGRTNYRRAGEALGYDYLNNPDLLLEPEHAAKASIWWWKDRFGGELRGHAQRGDVVEATKDINGGTNGLADRERRYAENIRLARSGQFTRDAETYLEQMGEEAPAVATSSDPESETGGGVSTSSTTVAQNETAESSSGSGSSTSSALQTAAVDLNNETPGQPTTPETPKEGTEQPTPRQRIVSGAAIDSSVGINEALNRDPVEARRQRDQQDRVAQVRDQEDRQRTLTQNDTLLSVKQTLEQSLTTQQSMDGRLRDVVRLLRENGGVKQEATPTAPGSEDPSADQQGRRQRGQRSSGLDFDPRDIADAVVDVTRRRSM